jgi:hypothetical protein
MKVTTEDFGLVTFERDIGRVLMEGSSHRYVIYAQDVVSYVRRGKGSSQVNLTISYRVDQTVLSLALTHRTAWEYVLTSLGVPSNRLANQFEATLAVGRHARALAEIDRPRAGAG